MEEVLKQNQDSTPAASPFLDGIVVSSPTSTHAPLIKKAAEYQLSVFTEKPVGETAQQIQQLFQLATRANINLCCGFQRRFDPSYKAATNAIAQGRVGTPVVANIFFAGKTLIEFPFGECNT